MRAETCTRLYAPLGPANVTIARPAAIERCLNYMRRRGIGRGKRKSAARGALLLTPFVERAEQARPHAPSCASSPVKQTLRK